MQPVDVSESGKKQAQVVLFPGVTEVLVASDPEPDNEADLERQADLLVRWRVLGIELLRRLERGVLPFDIALELRDLIDETNT